MKAHRWKLIGKFWECNRLGKFSSMKLEDKSCCMGCGLQISASLVESAVGSNTEDQFNYLDTLADQGKDNELLILDDWRKRETTQAILCVVAVILAIAGLVFLFRSFE